MDWIARFVGLFYLLGGAGVLHRARMNAVLDRGLAGITLKPTPRHERIIGVWMFVQAGLLALSGGLLLFHSRWAMVAFVVCWVAQAIYLIWHGRLPEAVRAPPNPAFVLYGVATLAVLAWGWTGVLH